mmetsp:Transcript_308/g.508  ORF Transcript_308/g.508 Transcript_308/m.508 type:complete len:669 (+) Transcript_308:81-2087(+)
MKLNLKEKGRSSKILTIPSSSSLFRFLVFSFVVDVVFLMTFVDAFSGPSSSLIYKHGHSNTASVTRSSRSALFPTSRRRQRPLRQESSSSSSSTCLKQSSTSVWCTNHTAKNDKQRVKKPLLTNSFLFYSPSVPGKQSPFSPCAPSSSSTRLGMVFTTPSSVIEQASTKILLDDLIDESVRTSARYPVMMQFDPSSGWIWRRWRGTVFSETWRTFVINMIYASIVCLIFKCYKTQFLQNLSGFNILWGQLLSVTTFTLTFFLNQSYSLWRNCYGFSRRLQGRLNDLNMTLAAHAARVEPKYRSDKDQKAVAAATTTSTSTTTTTTTAMNGATTEEATFSTYTEPARQVLELMARYVRVFNLLTYASFTGSHRPLLTPQGMRRLVDRGIITEDERKVLSDVQVPVTQRHNVLLLWIMRLFHDARKAGHIEGSDGFEQQFLEKCHVIRAQYGSIGDELAGRMPLAYAHIVQVLVDVILWMYPFMAFSTGMTPFLGVLGTGLLTMFYQGLFDLAKQFLDPYDNENYGKGDDPLCIDTLIAETNAGSVRWMNGLAAKPFALEKIKMGDTLDYQLPLRGWTVEETDEREENARIERERMELEAGAAWQATMNDDQAMLPLFERKILEVDEDVEEIMTKGGDGQVLDECQSVTQENMTMEEALEQMEECTEKVP